MVNPPEYQFPWNSWEKVAAPPLLDLCSASLGGYFVKPPKLENPANSLVLEVLCFSGRNSFTPNIIVPLKFLEKAAVPPLLDLCASLGLKFGQDPTNKNHYTPSMVIQRIAIPLEFQGASSSPLLGHSPFMDVAEEDVARPWASDFSTHRYTPGIPGKKLL